MTKNAVGKATILATMFGALLATNLGMVSPNIKVIIAMIMEAIRDTTESFKMPWNKCKNKNVDTVDIKTANRLFPIKTVIKVVSKCSYNFTISFEEVFPSSASIWNLYLFRQAKAVSVAL